MKRGIPISVVGPHCSSFIYHELLEGGVVVAEGRDGVEHPDRAIGQGNTEKLTATDEWFGEAILVRLAGDTEASCHGAVRANTERVRYFNIATLPLAFRARNSCCSSAVCHNK